MHVAGERIVIFGDSLSHPGADAGPTITDLTSPFGTTSAPGEALGRQLIANGAQVVRLDAKVGRSARSFLASEDSQALFTNDRAFGPTKVIVMLGTNDIDQGLTSAALAATRAAMIQIRDAYRAMGAEVFAIGPPSYLNDHYTQGAPAMLQLMQSVFGADHTIDARPLTVGAPRTGDGVHFVETGAAQVGPQLASAVLAVGPSDVDVGLSTGAKVALGVFGLAAAVGLSALVLRSAKQLALRRA